MERHGIAIVVEDGGEQLQQPPRVGRQALLTPRKTGLSGALHFLWRIFARLAGYVTRIRCIIPFKLGKHGHLQVKEDAERRVSEISENKVEGGLLEASRACEPELAEILVTSQKETTNHGIHDVDTQVVEVEHEGRGSKCTMRSEDMDEDSAPLACIGEHSSATEQSTSDSCQQEQLSAACEQINVILPKVDGEDCIANEEQKRHGLEQNASHAQQQNDGLFLTDGEVKCESPKQNGSQDEELVDAVINDKSDVLQVLSTDSNANNSEKGSSNGESPEVTSSPALKKRFSIKELNAVVAEQLTKCLSALERNTIPGKAEHRRAIILATLVAIIVWARNAKHLHESMPRIRGSAINVHFRSRL